MVRQLMSDTGSHSAKAQNEASHHLVPALDEHRPAPRSDDRDDTDPTAAPDRQSTAAPGASVPLRLLYIVSRWRQPTETFIRREIEAARAAGHVVVVVSLKPPFPSVAGDPVVVYLSPARVVRRVPVVLLRHPLRVFGALARTLRGARPGTVLPHMYAALVGVALHHAAPQVDWVHAHFAWLPATVADVLAAVRRQPFGIMPHAFDIYEERVIDRLLGQKLRRASIVVVESESIRRDVEQRFACQPVVLRMGVPDFFVRRDAIADGREEGLVLSVGALRVKKGHDVLLRALAHLTRPWRCIIVGDGAERENLERLSRSLGLSNRVTLAGALGVDQVCDWLDRAAVFALASRVDPSGDRDGVPNVLIEAMARGCPVVATNVSGIGDLVNEDRGVVVEPEDPVALARTLERLLSDRTSAARLAAAARDHVLVEYVVERNWARLEQMICTARESPRPAGA